MGLLAWAHVALFITITSGFDVYTDDNIHDVVKNGWLNYRSSNNLPKCCSDNNCKMVRLSSTLYKKVNQKGDQLRFSLRDGDDKMGAILSYSHQKGISGTVFFKKERKAYFLETIPEHEANDQSSPCYKSRYARSRYLFYRMKFIKSTDGKIPKQFLSANSAKAESPCCWGFMCKGVTGVDTGTLRADKNGALPDLYVPRGNQPASDLSEVFTMTATQPRKCRPTCTVYFYHNNRNEMLTISKSGSDSWSLHLEAEDGKDLRLKKCVDGQFLTQSRAASGKTLIPMRPAAKPKPSGSSKKASGKLSGGPKLPAGGYGMKKEKPTNTKFHEIDVSMQRVAPGEQCWYPNYICNQLKHVKKWFYLDATDPTKDDEDWIMDCYESFAECGGDCTHFTYSNYGGRPECTLHDGCDAVYNSKCFELGKCRSGPGDCEPLMANKNCTSAPDLGPDYSTWQCMDRMGKKLGPVQPNAPLPSATFCIIGCDSWLDTASTPANPIQGILSSRCQNDGTWSATTPLNGAPTLTYPLPPYPLPTAGVGESPSPLSCACPDLTLTLDGQVYDPNAEEAASFTCFSKNTFDPVTGFKIQANDVCILLCDGNHALTVMCSDQGWTNSPELGIWCYEKPVVDACPSSLPTKQNFNATAHLGQWYEQKSVPVTWIGREGRCVRVSYGIIDGQEDRISVYNVGTKADGSPTSIRGNATIPDPTKGELQIEFPGYPTGNYWILETDYSTFSIIYNCEYYGKKFEFAWILSREKHLDNSTIEYAEAILASNGVDVSTLEDIPQDDSCVYDRQIDP